MARSPAGFATFRGYAFQISSTKSPFVLVGDAGVGDDRGDGDGDGDVVDRWLLSWLSDGLTDGLTDGSVAGPIWPSFRRRSTPNFDAATTLARF